jgi:hypothetical protein
LSLFPGAAARRMVELLVEPAPGLPERYPERRPPVLQNARIIEGEILPRANRNDVLLDDYRNRVLPGRAEPVSTPPATAADTSGLLPASVVFYTLHSSADSLFNSPIGRHVNQYV